MTTAYDIPDSTFGSGQRVLIVDDEYDVGLLLSILLKKRGFSPHRCSTLSEARGMLSKLQFDYLFLDINLNDGNGLSLLAEKHIPTETHTIVMSAHCHLAEKAILSGAQQFLNKPFTTQSVLSAIKNEHRAG